MRRIAFALVAVAVLALGASVLATGGGDGMVLEFTPVGGPVTVTVSGRVTDAESGEPIADVLVRGHVAVFALMGPALFEGCPYQVTTTSADGRYALEFQTVLTTTGALKGRDGACVYASAPGYETRPVYVRPSVTPDKTTFTDVDIALGPGRKLHGRVVDENGDPVVGGEVRANSGSNGDWNQFGAMGLTRTGTDGAFELWITREKKDYSPRWLVVSQPGYGLTHVMIADEDNLGTVTVPRGGTIEGRVVDYEGGPIEGCEVSVALGAYGTLAKAVTAADGSYKIEGIRGEEVLKNFAKMMGLQYRPRQSEVTIVARTDPGLAAKLAPQLKVIPKGGETITAPDIQVGELSKVSGTLIAGSHSFGLRGLLVRVDFDWDRMVEVDAAGGFEIPYVSPGEHRLTAYLPMNLRGDRGIGSTEITVEAGKPVEDAKIELETLCEARVQFTDANGNPLEGIAPGATRSADGNGFWTEGTTSGADGWGVLYLYPGSKQYVRGFDRSERNLVAANYEQIEPREGDLIDYIRITMVQAAGIKGRFVDEYGAGVAGKRVSLALSYADGSSEQTSVETDETGAFGVKPHLRPGIVTLSAETMPLEFKGALANAMEVAPGGVTDLGVIVLQKVPFYKVSGTVVPSPTVTKVDGLKIRLDLTGPWQFVGETDAEGRFEVEVPEGARRLTAYVPWNLRFDDGIGHVQVDARADIEGVELPLDDLAVIRMTIVDQNGVALQGMKAITTFREDMVGPGNEGPPSDENGLSTVYVYPGDDEYAAPFDKSRKLRWKEVTKVNLEEGEVIEITGVLVPAEQE